MAGPIQDSGNQRSILDTRNEAFEQIAHPRQEATQTRMAPQVSIDADAAHAGIYTKWERLSDGLRPFFALGSSLRMWNMKGSETYPQDAGWQIEAGPGLAYPLLNQGDTYVQGIAGLDFYARPLELSGKAAPYAGLNLFAEEAEGLGVCLKLFSPNLENVGIMTGIEFAAPF